MKLAERAQSLHVLVGWQGERAIVGELHYEHCELLLFRFILQAEFDLSAAWWAPVIITQQLLDRKPRPEGMNSIVILSKSGSVKTITYYKTLVAYLFSEGSYTPLSPATDSSDTADVTPAFFDPGPGTLICVTASSCTEKWWVEMWDCFTLEGC